MRTVPRDLEPKLGSAIQTRANNSAPSVHAIISRATIPLTDENFLERQLVVESSSIEDVSIAVSHPKANAQNSQVFVGFIQNGVAKVYGAMCKLNMASHTWVDYGFSEPAEAISVAFDGTMPKAVSGDIEFVTEEKPWVFWINNGVLHARKLDSTDTIVLAESNCEDVSVARAMWSDVGAFDFGLCAFFILSGTIYYKQLIDGEWTDGTIVAFGPSGVRWTEIAVQRTWDYRVVLQAKTSSGATYEIFTQYMGIGKQTAEHIELRKLSSSDELTRVGYSEMSAHEHIELSEALDESLYGGLYSMSQPSILSVENISTVVDMDGELIENYGLRISVRFSVHLNPMSVKENLSAFVMRDGNGRGFAASAANTENGLDWIFTVPDFNNAVGECTMTYVPGNLYTMVETVVEPMSLSFTPENLTPSSVEPPKIMEVYNV